MAPRSVESGRVLSEFDCVYVSVAWELELPVLVASLRSCGIEPRRSRRPASAPLVVAGGPQTQSNPDALASISDAVFVGEADGEFARVTRALSRASDRTDALLRLSRIGSMWVPEIHGEVAAPEPRRAPLAELPARTILEDEPNQFGNAFLVETGRGCPRACTFCIVRSGVRKTSFVPAERILAAIPEGVGRVGLVGAAVSDHPQLLDVLETLVSKGVEVTLSSLRADRGTPALLSLLRRGGLKTLTIAADGVSDGIREGLRKGIGSEDLERCVEAARTVGIRNIRLYLMVGLPEESEVDFTEGISLLKRLGSRTRLSLSVSPFVPKRFTPLAAAPFADVKDLKRKIGLLKRSLGSSARVRSVSPRTARSEWLLSHASADEAFDLIESLSVTGSGLPGY